MPSLIDQNLARLLIIDDNHAIHDDFRKILAPKSNSNEYNEAEGALFGSHKPDSSQTKKFIIDSAYQGEEGLECVERALRSNAPYAMAFIDVRMPPGWDGIETTARIWEVDPDIQVVICTAYSDCSWDEMLERLGRSDRLVILKKPFDSVEALQLANSLTRKWQLLSESKNRMANLEETIVIRNSQVTQERERFRHIFNTSPEGIFQMTTDGRFVAANPALAAIYGYSSPAELLQGVKPVQMELYVDPERYSVLRARIDREGIAKDFESEIKCHDGSTRWIRETVCKSLGKDANTSCYQGFVVDITEQKKAQKERDVLEVQLRQVQKLEAIGQLAAGIAHEINTPIQYIGDNTRFLKDAFGGLKPILENHRNLLQAAEDNLLTPETIKSAKQAIASADLGYLVDQIPAAIGETLEGVDRVSKIVRAMKDFSHPGKKEKAPANLNKAVESTVTVAQNEWKQVAELNLDLDPNLPPVPCYLDEFNQVILNLIINASHAIGDVVQGNPVQLGRITIQTRQDGDVAEVRVSDSGTGIPEAVRPKIFEPFFTTKEVGKGTGQGLSIVYGSVVKKHGGTVSFETEVGRGTTFIIRLPITSPV